MLFREARIINQQLKNARMIMLLIVKLQCQSSMKIQTTLQVSRWALDADAEEATLDAVVAAGQEEVVALKEMLKAKIGIAHHAQILTGPGVPTATNATLPSHRPSS